MYRVPPERHLGKRDPRLWRAWIAGNAASGIVGWVLGGLVVLPLSAALGGTLLEYAVVGAIFLVVGFSQYTLTRYLDMGHGWWSWLTALGACAGQLLAYPMIALLQPLFGVLKDIADQPLAVGPTVGLLLLLINIGLFAGLAQWLLLRKKLARAGGWVLVSPLGAGLGGGAGFWVGGLVQGRLSLLAGWSIGMAIYALVTGLFLLWNLPAYPLVPLPYEEAGEVPAAGLVVEEREDHVG